MPVSTHSLEFPTRDATPEELESKALCDIGNMPRAKDKVIVLDIEGNTKDVRADPESQTLGLSYAYRLPESGGGLVSGYLPFRHLVGQNLPESFLHILQNTLHNIRGIRPTAHNAKYDLVGLRNNLGIDLLNSDFYCTMLMAHFLNENLLSKDLDYVSKHYGGPGKAKSEAHDAIVKSFGWEYVPSWMMAQYSTQDSESALGIFEEALPKFKREGFLGDLWETEREWLRLIVKMESVGIAINEEMCEKEIIEGELAMGRVCGLLGGNPGSHKFLSELMFERLKLPVVKRSAKTGEPSFDKTAMAEYEDMLSVRNDPTAQLILEYRGWQKTVSSNYKAYFDLRSPDGYLRPNYKLHGTRTSRLSCEKPNLQQIPRSSPKRWNGNLKKAFVPRPGFTLWEVDYGQLELRLAAIYSGEPSLLDAFRRGINIFSAMASTLSWPRDDVKVFTYATLYGGGNKRISDLFHISTQRSAGMREQWFSAYPSMRETSSKASRLVKQRGYVKYWTGRRRHFEDREKEAHKAFNAILQGGGAELVKQQGIRVGHAIDWDDCKMLLQVHDSYMFEIRNGTENHWLPLIQGIMEDVAPLNPHFAQIPFIVDIHRWGTKEQWNS